MPEVTDGCRNVRQSPVRLRSARVILFYALAVCVLGAVVAPWAYGLIHPHWSTVPFRRVFDRALLVVALAGLWPMLRAAGVRSWSDLGYARTPTGWKQVVVGFGIGLISLGVCAVLLRQFSGWKTNYVGNLASALAVGIIEETFFRGGIYGGLRRGGSVGGAVAVSSILYAVLHFCKPTEPAAVNWSTGFTHLGLVFQNFGAQVNWCGLVTLILVGVVLALAFEWTQALYLSIGLHTGWVFAIKTVGAPLRDNALLWPVLLVVLLLCWKKFAPRST